MKNLPERTTIVFLISNLEYGGAQRQLVELVNNMDQNAFDIHVVSLSNYIPLSNKLKIDHYNIHVIQKRFKFDVSVIFRVSKLLKKLDAHILQAYLYDAEITARIAGFFSGTALVIGSERNTDYKLKRKQMLVYHLTKPLRDICIANSNSGRDFNQSLLGYPDDHYFVVHNGVDTNRFQPINKKEARQKLLLDADLIYVGMFGSFKAQKNHPLLFKAAVDIVKVFPKIRFLLVGDELHGGLHGSSDYKVFIEKMIDDLGLRHHCIFLGNRDDVEVAYNACDITVLPSLFEGTPNVILESMACAVPVIATDVSDNAMILPDNIAGYIVPLNEPNDLANKVITILENNSLRNELGENARSWVDKEFSTARLALKTETIYIQQLQRKIFKKNR